MNEIHENSVRLLINFQNGIKMHMNEIFLMINGQNGILMQQHKFPCNVKLINFMRILSVIANSVNETI